MNNELPLPQAAANEGTPGPSEMSSAKRALLRLRLGKNRSATGDPAIPRRIAHGPAPLSFAQQRLWLLDQLEPGSSAYNVPRALRLSGTLHTAALQRALNALVARHEALRTTFALVDGDPVQIRQPERIVPVDEIDLRSLPDSDRDAEALRRCQEAVRRPFDLCRDLMIRAILVRLAADDHILLLVSHHIASDGWSKGVLFGELSALYQAFVTGAPIQLPELPIQYADFAQWQRQQLQDKSLRRQLSYWKTKLVGMPALLELPPDRPRPAVQTYQGAKHYSGWPKTLHQALQALSQNRGVTVFMTLLAAFKVLLCRYTGQQDIVVGTQISGRNRPEVEKLLGLFTNSLVLRTDLSGDPPFRELLRRVRQTALEAYDQQDVPFEKLVEELQPERDLSRSPLFQVGFALDPPAKASQLSDLTVRTLDIDAGVTKVDFFLSMSEEPDGLRTKVEYSTDLFDEATIERMVGNLRVLLEGIVANPEQRISELPLLTPAQERQLLIEWNSTDAEYPRDRCFHELFEEQVQRTPDAIALIFEDERLTYRDLNRRANRLAHRLQALGVGPDVMVGIAMERSARMVVALLGVMKAGGAYLPLDPAFPKDRLAFMLTDSQAPVLLTEPGLVTDLPPHSATVLCLDSAGTDLDQECDNDLCSGVSPDNLAYLIYTSGSTGEPKGAQIPHRALVNFLMSVRKEPGITAQDKLLAVTSLSFDIAGLELYLPLLVGATVEVASRGVASDANLLRQRLAVSHPTVMQATPATWRLLLESGWQGSSGLEILCGGEALSRELADQLCARGAELWNLYGPTETTIWSLTSRVRREAGPISIGRPLDNTQVYVLDRHLRPVPVGVAGELYIGGDGLARGYLHRPELTAQRFVPDPFRSTPNGRLYKTGDLVRYRANGTIQFLDRLDNQVKVHGFRIELGEIESVLARHPGVRAAVVAAREDSPGEKQLVAYVICMPGQEVARSELRELIRLKLPEYMMPGAFVMLHAFPLTPNGKVDRRALPGPDQSRSLRETPYVAPRGPIEEALAGIWAEVLKLGQVGVQHNFFALGGNSLMATRVISRVRERFQTETPLRTLFEAPTIEALALRITQTRAAQFDSDRIRQLLDQVASPR